MRKLLGSSALEGENNKSFLNEEGKVTSDMLERCYLHYSVGSSEEGKRYTDTLTISWSKWLDEVERVRVEAYMEGGTPKKTSSGDATCSRIVQAQPEVVEAYWMNASGERVRYGGYEQDLYLYINTLGLKGKTLEVQVHEQDFYQTPSLPIEFYGPGVTGDELIDWKNNSITIEKHEVLKQFKVGDKKRYEDAAKDEADDDYKKAMDEIIDQGLYTALMDVSQKYTPDLELYIHFPQQEHLKLEKDNQYARLTLTEKTQIRNAYFGTVAQASVQGDTPATKDSASPSTKVTYYPKLETGVLGQRVHLIAECPNLNGKTVCFEVFEKTPLLEEENKALTLLYKEEPQTRIKVRVKDGFAVAEVKLQPCKEDTDNEDWEQKLDPDQGALNTAELYIKAVATENTFTVRSSGEFLKDKPFMLKGTTAIQDIYHDGTISKVAYQENEVKMKKVKFIYHDANSLKHDLGKFDIIWVQKWKNATKHSWKGTDPEWKKVTVEGETRYYQYDGEKQTPLIMPYTGVESDKKFSYSRNSVTIKLYEKTEREYHNPIALATIFGTLAEVGYDDVVCNGSVGSDGTGAYSLTHYNGINTDFKFLRKDKKKAKIDKDNKGNLIPIILSNDSKLDIDRQNKLIDALYKFGWGKTAKILANKTSENKNFNHCKSDSNHWNHLHIQGLKPNYKT